MNSKLEIYTLGGVRIQCSGESITGLSTKKAEALLIYLASTKRQQPREVLADLLWDERTQSQAMGNLRGVLTNLRQVLGDYIIITRDEAGINPEADAWLDTAELESCLASCHEQSQLNPASANRLAETLVLYKGEFLQGFSVFDCRRFEDWSVRERERLHHLAVDGFSTLVDYEIEQAEYQKGMAYASRLLEMDPLMESAHRQMMHLLAANGNRTAALNQYEICKKLIKSELEVEPEAETRELYENIRIGNAGKGDESKSLPGGTVTFLFTDIEGSTRLLEQLREQYAQVLAEQRGLLREAFQRWRGHEVDTQGDAFFVAFGRATDAIACAVDAQQKLFKHDWLKGVSVRVRMGIHTGEPVIAHTGYVGMDVHRASRIANVGYGGQVLLSQTTRDLVYMNLPTGTRLRDLGGHMLKDMRYPQEIYQLEIPDLPTDFPPLKSLERLEIEEEPPAPGKSPYMGLQYFDEEQAEWFFGRQAVTDRLVEAVSSRRFLAVIGASGSGKSSVVRAGLVPAIKTMPQANWEVMVITPSSNPLEALAICLTKEKDSPTATATLIDEMQTNPRSLDLYCQKKLVSGKDTRLLLVIDQFEELFTLCRSEKERLSFVNNLLYAVGIPKAALTSVITLRADFYACLAQYVGLRELVSAHQIYIGPMNALELRAAIEEPAKRGGWELSPGLVELILSDLGAGANRQPEPGAMPLLSHALLETWKHRRGRLLNLKAYTEAGGVRGAIAKTAEGVFYRELTLQQQGIAKDIFLRLTELGEGTQDTRRRISIQELIPPGPAVDAEQIMTVLGKLADARLIITGEETVEVAHEALIREWPTLREWLASDRDSLRLHRHLTEAAQEWELLERDAGALYRGTRLNQAVEWAMANPRALNAKEQAYLEASRSAAEREQLEQEATRLRELEAAQKLAETEKGRAEAESQRAEEQANSAKRLRRRAWLLSGVLVLALILAAAAGILGQQANTNYNLANQNLFIAKTAEGRALSQQAAAESEARQRATAEVIAEQERGIAQEQARLATSRYLTSAALNNLELNPQLSAHLVLQALQTYPTVETENTLHKVLPELRELKATPLDTIPITDSIGGSWYQTILVNDGKLIIQLTTKGIELVDMTTREVSMLASGSYVFASVSQDNRWLIADHVSEGEDGKEIWEFHVWDINTKEHLFSVPQLGVDYFSIGLISPSPTHSQLVFACYMDMTVHVWEVSSGLELYVLRGHSQTPPWTYLNGTANRDGTHLATYGTDGQVILWDMETGDKLQQFTADPFGIGWAVFSPDGSHLATWGFVNKIIVWDLTSEGPGQDFIINQEYSQQPLLYSPDGTRLAAPCMDGLVRLWEARTGELELVLAGSKGISFLYSFSQDGKQLYTGSNEEILRVWDLTPRHELLSFPASLGSRSFSPPDKEQLALIAGNSISIASSQTGEELRSWQAHANLLTDIAWSPDGNWLATSSGDTMATSSTDYQVKIWDAGTGQLQKDLSAGEYTGLMQLDWSTDSSLLATTHFTFTNVWDVASGDLLYTLNQPVIPGVGSEVVGDVAFSPDGQKIATGSYNSSLAIWDALTGSQMYTQTLGHSILYLAFSPDGQQLASSQTDGNVLLFNFTNDGMEAVPGFTIGTTQVRSLAFSPDGALLAVGDPSGTITIWDLETRQLRLKAQTFTDPVTQIAFSFDSRYLAASGQAGMTYFYVLPVDELIDLARSRIIRPMNPEECWEYLHQETCPEWP